MSDEWGPWIEHNGNGCPCVGEYVQCVVKNPAKEQFMTVQAKIIDDHTIEYIPMKGGKHRSWIKGSGFNPVIRYRIRKPKGMQLIESILREVEETDPARYTREKELEVVR